MKKLEEIVPTLNDKLKKSLIPSKVLLDKFRLVEESSRKTGAYTDPTYAPFYFYIGRLLEAESLAEIGFRLGLLSGCFIKGNPNIKSFFAFQEASDEFYSFKLGYKNIQDLYKGDFKFHYGNTSDEEFQLKFCSRDWDVIIINEELSYDRHREYMDLAWQNLSFKGVIINDYAITHKPVNQAYLDFCKIQNREPTIIKTRYGVGLVQK